MNTAEAIDHLWLFGANDHTSTEDGSYLHPLHTCETCFALEEVRKLVESLRKPMQVRMLEDEEAAIGVPHTITLEPLTLPLDIAGETTLEARWDVDELQLSMVYDAPAVTLRVTGALELGGLVELRDKLINPAIAHHEARQQAEADEAERQRIEHAARAEERAREEAEREHSQTFRAVSVTRTITPNMTIHGRTCASLAWTRKRQTPGTTIFALTPSDLIRKLPSVMTGRLGLRFCAKCKPIPEAQRFNAELIGAAPEIVPEGLLLANISDAIWEAHHAILGCHNEEGS